MDEDGEAVESRSGGCGGWCSGEDVVGWRGDDEGAAALRELFASTERVYVYILGILRCTILKKIVVLDFVIVRSLNK